MDSRWVEKLFWHASLCNIYSKPIIKLQAKRSIKTLRCYLINPLGSVLKYKNWDSLKVFMKYHIGSPIKLPMTWTCGEHSSREKMERRKEKKWLHVVRRYKSLKSRHTLAVIAGR